MNRSLHKAVFFDRDNTLIVDRIYLNDPEQISYLPGVIDCLQRIAKAGYEIVVVTNQSGVPRGLVKVSNLHEIHRRIAEHFRQHEVEVAGFYYAPFLPSSSHPMRKPRTGMLDKAAHDLHIDLRQSWMVGDRKTDVEAGIAAGSRTVFLHGTEEPDFTDKNQPDGVAKDLTAVADLILSC